MTSYRGCFLGFTEIVLAIILPVVAAPATTRLVWQGSPSPAPPHDTWATAAHTIQEAVDVAVTGDVVIVSGATYDVGGRSASGALLNRVLIDKAIVVQSLMGPEVTVIKGAGGAPDETAVRGVYLGSGAVLSGFTIRDGHTLPDPNFYDEGAGGGIYCESPSTTVTNCIILGNSARWGGGVYGGYLSHCVIRDNSALWEGGGADYATLENCTLTGNQAAFGAGSLGGVLRNCALTWNRAADTGGGSYSSTHYSCTVTDNTAGRVGGGVAYGSLYNCVVYYNDSPEDPNHFWTGSEYTCITPLPPAGIGNIADEPALASTTHLSSASPCIGAGADQHASGLDIDDEPWLSPPCMGADQVVPGAATSALSVAIDAEHTEVVPGFAVSFRARIEGQATRSEWDFADGTTLTNRPLGLSHAWANVGTYPVRLTAYNDAHPAGVSATLVIEVVELPMFYVNQANLTPLFPYKTWQTAAKNIQDAIGAGRTAGRCVWVTNGVYDTGGTAAAGSLLTNRVALTSAVTVRSVNGPLATLIVGAAAPGNTNGDGAVRCAWVGKGSVLDGFTLTNGHTRVSGATGHEQSGAGVWGEGNPIVTNCVLTGNWAARDGGGADSVTLLNCLITGNRADDDAGGADQCTLYDCTLTDNVASQNGGGADSSALHRCALRGNMARSGGAVDDSTLFNCTLANNVSTTEAGGASESVLHNCVLSGNETAGLGGGARYGELYNCTVTGNRAGRRGGGVEHGRHFNCIVYYNRAPLGPNHYDAIFDHSCTTPLPTNALGNIDADPQLASASHLSASSPCIGAGADAYVQGLDIDGEPWLSPPCMGTDQFVPGNTLSPLTVSIDANHALVTPGFPVSFQAEIEGQATHSRWEFDDGQLVKNQPVGIRHAWDTVGTYVVRLTVFNDANPAGVSATVVVEVIETPVFYVNQGNPTPAFPFRSWETAAATIQEAVGASQVAGRLVWVAKGIYDAGATVRPGGRLAGRIALTNPVTVRSVDGPLVTLVQGSPPDTNGDGAVRCAFVGDGAVLDGFTLTNGHTPQSWIDTGENQGGGAWCEEDGMLTNCILTGNSAYWGGAAFSGRIFNSLLASNSASYGGGAYRSTLHGSTLAANSCTEQGGGAIESTLHLCVLTNNRAWRGGGAYECTIYDSILTGNRATSDAGGAYESTLYNTMLLSNAGFRGGAAFESTLYSCRLVGNRAAHDGGGTDNSTLFNCVLTGNSASDDGGGTDESTLFNCTVVGNSARDIGGGASESSLYNSILLHNTANSGANYGSYRAMEFCCTQPLPFSGTGNITDDPAFMDLAAGDFHLRYGSPCIDAGTNLAARITTDLDGFPRPLDGNWDDTPSFDIGAFEYNPQTADSTRDGIPDFWCRQFGFDPNDPGVAAQNPDQDSFDNRQEWIADTDPTDANSGFRIVALSNSTPVTVYFHSSSNRNYSLLYSVDPADPAWEEISGQVNIPGQGTLQGLADTNAVGTRFYRVRVVVP